MKHPLRIALLYNTDTALTSLLGPIEIFQLACRREQPIEILVTGEHAPPVDLNHLGIPFVKLSPDVLADSAPIRQSDILIVCAAGPRPSNGYHFSPTLTRFLCSQFEQGTHIASICTGAFLLAESGLLNGHRATTHWLMTPHLANTYPEINVDAEAMLTKAPKLWTAGGAYAFQDLCLALVDQYISTDRARRIAELLLLEPPRQQQSHYANLQQYQQHQDKRVAAVQRYIEDHFSKPMRLSLLADIAALSPRQLSRRFLAACRISPLEYAQQVRIMYAKDRLTESGIQIQQLAQECGFEDAAYFRQLFKLKTGMSPLTYKARCCASDE